MNDKNAKPKKSTKKKANKVVKKAKTVQKVNKIVEEPKKKIENIPVKQVEKEVVEPKKVTKKIKREESIIDLVSMRINETLKADRKNTTPKNNPYFWIIKGLMLIAAIIFIVFIFNALEEIGTEIIYEINKSLRSVLSGIWIFTVSFIKNILVLYLIYSNVVQFVESPYYDRLYRKDLEMRNHKDILFDRIIKVLRLVSILFLIVLFLVAAFAIFIFFYFIFIWFNGTKILSPFIVSISVVFITYLAYRHILVGFFNSKQEINNRCYVLGLLLVLFGAMFLFYELKDFKYSSSLPEAFETKVKFTKFDISKKDKVIINNTSKLNNIKIQTNDSLGDEIHVYVEYYKTAKVNYIYQYNDNDDLLIKFDSDTTFGIRDIPDALGMVEKGLIDKTIYNFNLFKYPNIKIFVNTHNADRIFLD